MEGEEVEKKNVNGYCIPSIPFESNPYPLVEPLRPAPRLALDSTFRIDDGISLSSLRNTGAMFWPLDAPSVQNIRLALGCVSGILRRW